LKIYKRGISEIHDEIAEAEKLIITRIDTSETK
jgi:hypothetical protein